MKQEIVNLQNVMKEKGIDAWIAPSADAHQSEYVAEYDSCRKYLSGFTGSAGTLVVLKDSAFLWTDGRYFTQAPIQLAGSGIEVMKMGEKGVPTILEFLETNMKKGEVLGFYGKLFGVAEGESYETKLIQKGISLKIDEDIVDIIWKDRPKRNANKIWSLVEYCGEDILSKIDRVRKSVKENGADLILVSSLSDIAWLTNLRGSDIETNPLFLSYLAICSDCAKLFVQKEALTDEIKEYFSKNNVEINDYDKWYDFVATFENKKIFIDRTECNFTTYKLIKDKNEIICGVSPLTLMKIIKNDTEIANFKKAHIRDGVYMTRFTKWVRENVAAGKKMNEVDASDYLDNLRLADEKSVSLSFDTIAGYADNGAIVHYKAKRETAKLLEAKGLYLYDSGGHYLDGTTDVTRTTALGETTFEERLHYTLVTVSMLRLLNARFKQGAIGLNLDTFARQRLWEYGLDYNHGTGHGVGFCNTVHEGPNSIRFRANPDFERNVELKAGMVLSDEPGVYIEGKHGIRMEILVVVVEDEVDGFLKFDCLTYAPIDPNPLEISAMRDEEIELYNNYQADVYKKLSPYLNDEEKEWLKNETRKISR
jgi:hypothetical protein